MKTINNKVLITVILALTMCVQNRSFAGDDNRYTIGEKVSLHSKILEEERNIIVYLPASYNFSSMDYGVMYLLDGETHFLHVSGISSFLAQTGEIPEMIVVAITNVDRSRDFSPTHVDNIPTSGGADKFLSFLSKELIPFVDRNYRTLSYDILVGHSFGGTFATYSLLSEPDLFSAYISISPYLMFDDGSMVNMAEKKLKSKYDNIHYYMTLGNEPTYVETLNRFQDIVEDKKPEGLVFSYTQYKEEDHGSVPHLSVYHGLRSIFSDWPLSNETFREGLAAIDGHYAKLTEKYDYPVRAPEAVINRLGYYYVNNKSMDKAIAVFKANTERFPESANVYDSLGEAYEKDGQTEEATKYYSLAVTKAKKTDHPNLGLYEANLMRTKELSTNK